MAKKEIICFSCDMNFTVSYQGKEDIVYCPFCGENLEQNDGNEYEDDQEDE